LEGILGRIGSKLGLKVGIGLGWPNSPFGSPWKKVPLKPLGFQGFKGLGIFGEMVPLLEVLGYREKGLRRKEKV